MKPAVIIEKWLDWLLFNKGRSPGTATKYRYYLTELAAWLAEQNIPFNNPTPEQLEQFTGMEAHRRGMLPRSRRPLVAGVRGFYAWMQETGQISSNPAARLPYPKAAERIPVGMSLINGERLMMAPDLETFIGVRDAAIIATFIGCGLRLAGLVNLNRQDLVWTEYKGQEWMIIRVREKGDKERLIPAPHECRLLMRAYLNHPDHKGINAVLPDGNDVLFVSTNNHNVPAHEYYGEARRLAKRTIHTMIDKYGERAGIPQAERHPHALRHLYGTELVEDDINILKVQALLGHVNANTTKIYTRMAMRSLQQAVELANPLSKMRTPVSDLVRSIT